jgi:hypothetical protein
LLEARRGADLVVLGGLNEACGRRCPRQMWLPPKFRANLGMPTLDGDRPFR